MANLITEKQKIVLSREYLVRLTAVFFLLAAVLGVFFLIYVVTYYTSVSKNDLVVGEQFKSVLSAENKENTGESATRLVAETSDEMKAVGLYRTNPLIPSADFAQIISAKNSNIRINMLSFSLIKAGQGQFTVNGIARNRDGLVTFIEDLKTRGGFATVDSPVSDLAKDSDITFTVSIKTN